MTGSKTKNLEKGESLMGGQTEAKKFEDQQFTTCVFIPKNRLNLIPFYDLYALREFEKSRSEF